VLIDKLKSFDYELYSAEIANIQLLKFRVYKEKASIVLKETSNSVAGLDRMGFFERLFTSKLEKLNKRLGIFQDRPYGNA